MTLETPKKNDLGEKHINAQLHERKSVKSVTLKREKENTFISLNYSSKSNLNIVYASSRNSKSYSNGHQIYIYIFIVPRYVVLIKIHFPSKFNELDEAGR